MNIRQLASLQRRHDHPVSRRNFVRLAAGSLAAGAVLRGPGSQVVSAYGPDHANPVPIPLGSFGFHVNAPGFPGGDSPDADPSTITDFHGFTGLGYISGVVTRTNRKTHEKVDLPFGFADMRFMDGEYRGFDGRIRRGTFAFI
jgi:hypothetical protein